MKARYVNLVLFCIVLAVLIAIPFLSGKIFTINQNAPWLFSPFNSGDSLSTVYKERYRILEQNALIHRIEDTTRTIISVMIDGWGVPYDDNMLEQDFASFGQKNVVPVVHKRLLNYTSHAENVEYRTGFSEGVFVANGDSLVCAKKEKEQGGYFKQIVCCENCNDLQTVDILDSLASDGAWSRIAWTAHGTREGARETLHEVLRRLSAVAGRHPDAQFIIQGTHRPILGTPETRRKYNAHWVPAVFINCKLKTEKK